MIGQLLITALALTLIFVISIYFFGNGLTVDKTFDGRRIDVRIGDTIRIELEQLGAAGYDWEIQDLDWKHFEILSEETVAMREAGDFTGGPLLRRWMITVKKAGDSKLRFLHYRHREGKENASNTFMIKVRIGEVKRRSWASSGWGEFAVQRSPLKGS